MRAERDVLPQPHARAEDRRRVNADRVRALLLLREGRAASRKAKYGFATTICAAAIPSTRSGTSTAVARLAAAALRFSRRAKVMSPGPACDRLATRSTIASPGPINSPPTRRLTSATVSFMVRSPCRARLRASTADAIIARRENRDNRRRRGAAR